jgi:hypothetical protein
MNLQTVIKEKATNFLPERKAIGVPPDGKAGLKIA